MCKIKVTLEGLVKDYEGTLLAFTISKCQQYGIVDKDFARSHLQDCYLKFNKILDRINSLDEGHRLNYLLTVTKNFMIDKLRRSNKITYNSDYINDQNLHLLSEDHLALENHDAIDQIMSILSPVEQTILDFHLQGYTYQEISEKINLPTRTVGVKLFRLKAKVRRKFSHLRFW
ncbi:MAG: sigma-70 family RNA polymerase sigma factor [Saprospiraceae bacterium]|jgi:RNA polymerase sigma factor (sigma-70 family)|nr:sigma-70 family RNA polymerase sigma factor [Saprospiraceae bacterium]